MNRLLIIPNYKVGNKIDLDLQREVSMKEGIELAMHCNCPFIEASAKFRFNVDTAFYMAIDFLFYLNH